MNVIPPSEARIIGSSFSNDGNYVYYAASLPSAPVMTVYRTPVIGGAEPRKIIENVDSPVSLSPDDGRMAFFRTYPETGEEALFVADADGTGERKISSRDGKNLFYTGEGAAPAWSPDGSVIACPAGSTVGKFAMEIVVVGVDDPRERPVTSAGWQGVGRIVWHPDGRGLIACTEAEGEPPQISYVSYPGGEVTRVTNDLLTYGPSSLSITRDASAIVSAQSQTSSTIMVARAGDASAVREITRGATRNDGTRGLDWIDDGRIVYTVLAGGTVNLWASGIDGSEPRQMTFGVKSSYDPSAHPPGGMVYYTAQGDSLPSVWRIGAGGGKPQRITRGGEDYNPEISPDGRWLLFDSWRSGNRSIWKQDVGASDTAVMFRSGATGPRFSPDGRLVFCLAHDAKEQRMRPTVLSFPGAETVHVFDFPGYAADEVRWSPDGRTLHFIESRKGVSNVRAYDFRKGTVTDITTFTSGTIFDFAWSPDGKNLAVAHGQTTSDIVLLSISK
jgi:Tol biopolymer transport system component